MNVFRPKEKNAILESFKHLSVEKWEMRRTEFEKLFGEDVPKEYRPLIINIIDNLKERNIILTETWSNEVYFRQTKVNGYGRSIGVTEFSLTPRKSQDEISMVVFPFRKIKDIDNNGNQFIIKSFEDYLKIAEFYKL